MEAAIDVVKLSVLPQPMDVSMQLLSPPHSSIFNIQGEMVVFLDPANPEGMLGDSVVGDILQANRARLFHKDRKGKTVLSEDVVTLLTDDRKIHCVMGGTLEGDPERDDFQVPGGWRDATAKVGKKLYRDDPEAPVETSFVNLYLGEHIVNSPNAEAALTAVGRALGNLGYNEKLYVAHEAERRTDGKLPATETVKDPRTPEQVRGYVRRAIENVYLVSGLGGDDDGLEKLASAFEEGDHVSRMQTLTRFLAEVPHRLLDCPTFVHALVNLFESLPADLRESGKVKIEIYANKAGTDGLNNDAKKYLAGTLDELKLEALERVHAGSLPNEAGPYMVRLIYQGAQPNDPYTIVAAKSVMFDTGGYSLKPSAAMNAMESDMLGGAEAAAVFARLVEAQEPVNVEIVFPIMSNKIGPGAQLVGDPITLPSGRTVDVDNTDAEGRLGTTAVGGAAINLHAAKGTEWDTIVDLATKTGHAMVVGGDHSVITSSNRPLRHELEAAAVARGERVQSLRAAPIDTVGADGKPRADLRNIPNLPPVFPGAPAPRGTQGALEFFVQGLGVSPERVDRILHWDIAPELWKNPVKARPGDTASWPRPIGDHSIKTLYDFMARRIPRGNLLPPSIDATDHGRVRNDAEKGG